MNPSPNLRSTPATIGLLVLLLACFLLQVYLLGFSWRNLGADFSIDNLVKSGGTAYPLTFERNEYWRLLTAIVLHGSFVHLALNALALWRLGANLEMGFGPERIVTAFLLTGLVGTLASGIFNHEAVSIGASGGIFGLLGFGVACGVRSQAEFVRQIQRNAPNLLLVFISSAIIPNVDNFGHAGGLVSGLLLGVLDARMPRNLKQILFVVSVAALLFALVKIAMNTFS